MNDIDDFFDDLLDEVWFWDVQMRRRPEGWQRAVKCCEDADMMLWALQSFYALGFDCRTLTLCRLQNETDWESDHESSDPQGDE